MLNLGYIRGNVANWQDYTVYSELHEQSGGKINVACLTTAARPAFKGWDRRKIRFERYEQLDLGVTSNYDWLDVSEFYRDYSRSVLENFHGRTAVTVFDNLPFGISRGLSGQLSARAELVIARTPMIRSALMHEGVPAEKIKVIPSAVDTTRFKPGLTTGTFPVVMFVGRLAPEKGLWDLIVALKGLNTELHVVGAGDTRPYEELAVRCDVSIKFFGEVPNDELPARLRTASILCVPSIPKINIANPEGSWVEQFGVVLLEGMSTGLPIVATNTGSIPDIVVHGKTGFLVNPRDWFAMNHYIAQLLGNSSLRNELGGAGRDRVIRLFSTKVVGAQLAEAYS